MAHPHQTTDRSVPAELDAGRLANRSTGHCLFVLVVITFLAEIVSFEFTFVYPALGEIATMYQTTSIGWTLTLASLVGASITATVGKLSDMYGKKRVIIVMAGVFALGSVVCAVAPTFEVLLLGRVLQGVAIPINAVSFGLVRDVLPRRLVPLGLGVLSSGVGMASVAGPLLGGALIDAFSVHSIFWFLLFYGLVFGLLHLLVVPETPVRNRQRLDIGGAVTLFVSIGLILLSVSYGPQWGWGSWKTLAALVIGVAALIAFVQVERSVAEPLMRISLLRREAVRRTLLVGFLGQFPLAGFAFLNPLMQQSPRLPGNDHGLGLSAFRLGVEVTLFQGGFAVIFGIIGGWLCRRWSPRLTAILGCAALTGATVLLAVAHGSLWQVQIMGALAGAGTGLYYAATSNLLVEAVPAKEQGIIAGMQGIVAGVSASAASALLGTVLGLYLVSSDSATGIIVYGTAGFQISLVTCAIIGAVGVLLALRMRHGCVPATGGVDPDAVPTPRDANTKASPRTIGDAVG